MPPVLSTLGGMSRHGFSTVGAAAAAGDFIAATGGTVTTDGDYKVHKFTAGGDFIVTDAGGSSGSNTVELLVVAGGGGSAEGGVGGFYSGGGGAGGYRSIAAHTPSSGVETYAVEVGGGGPAEADGNDSSVDEVSASAGGCSAGKVSGSLTYAQAGGSGGGGCWEQGGWDVDYGLNDGGAGDYGGYGFSGDPEGYDGGAYNTGGQGAPGGGSSAQGSGSGSTPGGPGTDNDIVEATVDVTYATGGVGNSATAGPANTGNGAGGYYTASAGGSGIVVIRYKFQ